MCAGSSGNMDDKTMREEVDTLLKAWQIFQFRLEEPCSSSREQADVIRTLLVQLEYLLQSGKLDQEVYEIMINLYKEIYTKIVDEQDENKGLNNYAEQSIKLTQGLKNDSCNWKSSLSLEGIHKLGIATQCKEQLSGSINKQVNKILRIPPLQKKSTTATSTSTRQMHQSVKEYKNVFSYASTGTYEIKNKKLDNHATTSQVGVDEPEFITAQQQFVLNERKRKGNHENVALNYGETKKSLGYRRGPSNRFRPPIRRTEASSMNINDDTKISAMENTDVTDERLKGIEPRMLELINNEIMDHGDAVEWDDIAGLDFAKNVIKEIVVWPMLRPDIFTGLRGPPKGLLLFGPPGTGKTLIGKCIASQSKATFFSISASSLTSKWVGEGEKMVRALFAVARCHQPAVIFIDEIDSLLSQRCDTEHESSRRIKTEFLIQLDGATTNANDRLLIVGATNRPQEIDEAARRRMVKRLYIPLPEGKARNQIITNLLKDQSHMLTEDDMKKLVDSSEGYSGSDMSNLCREASLGPIRSISTNIQAITPDQVRPIKFSDFENAFKQVRASVSSNDLDLYVKWNNEFGSGH